MTNKKELSSLFGTKALNFCGTTQINDCLYNRPLLLHTNMRTPLITDRVPVGVYSPNGFQAALASPFRNSCAAAFHQPRLSKYTRKDLLLLRSGLFMKL